MAKFVCTVCGYVYEGEAAPEKCPVCGVGADKFKKQEDRKSTRLNSSHTSKSRMPSSA